MKIYSFRSVILFLLIICLFLCVAPITVYALEIQNTLDSENLIAGMVSVEDIYGKLDSETVPDIIDYNYAVSKAHVQRLYKEESTDLNRIVFLNADGTQTAYIFDFPVKYIDKQGEIKDITLDIADSSIAGQFESAGGSSITTFSKNISDGIGLVGNNTSLTLVPHLPAVKEDILSSASKLTSTSKAKRVDNKIISYDYDSKTTIEYSLTYTGFKEDIVVSEYTGQTEYDFTLYTNGLKLTENDESFCLVDQDNVVKATLGNIIIFTSDEKNNTLGDLKAQTIIENQEYLLTIVVDSKFLAAEETVYPIRIDPTIEICYDKNGVGAISDVTLNSNSDSSAASGSLFVGVRETYGISRILMKFPGLNLSSLGNNITIINATVEVRDLMCEGTALDVSCYVFSGNVWDESTVNWSNVKPNNISTFLSSNIISFVNGTQQVIEHRYSFDITQAVEGWRTGKYNPNKGIIFKGSSSVENGSTYNYKTIASYNRASYRPSLSVTYRKADNLLKNDIYYLNNKYCGDYLRYASSSATASSGLISSLGNSIRWEIRSVEGGYVIRSKSDTTKYLGVPTSTDSTSVSIITISNSTIPKRCIWDIKISSVGGCLVKNIYNSKYLYSYGNSVYTASNTGSVNTSTYNTRVWRVISQSDMLNREMGQSSDFNTLIINTGSTKAPTLSLNPVNAIWSSYEDFIYSPQITKYITISDGVFTGKASGVTTVIATHKVTDRKFVFSVIVGGDKPTFTVRNYIDQGYRIRFGGYSSVLTYNSIVSEKFEQLFGVDISSVNVLHTSAADTCKINVYGSVSNDNLNSKCIHSPTHLTTTALRDIMGNGTNICSRVLWTGHILTGNPASNANSSRFSVIITPKHTTTGSNYANKSDSEVRKESIFTLMHELSHQLGAPDHYCYGIKEGETMCSNKNCDICYMGRTTIRSCMMSYRCNIENINDATLYCSSCLADICNHLSDHH